MAESDLKIEFAPISRDPAVSRWATTLSPQDPTLVRAGGQLAIYDEIRRDPHAHSVLQKRALEVTSREWSVTRVSDRRVDKRAGDLVEKAFKRIDFDRLTRGLLGAVLKGYAVAEIIWDVVDGDWLPVKIKVRRQRRFRFTVEGECRLLTREAGLDGIPLPDRKFIVHRFALDDTDDDPYGLGLGSVLYWPAWFKRQVLGHWLGAGERHAEPDLVLKYQGEYDRAKEQQLLAAVANRAANKVMAIPSSIEADLLESARAGGGDALEKLARYLDEMTSTATLGETLSTNVGDSGSRSLGDIHNQVRIAIAKADADAVCQTLNETIVRWIVDANAIPVTAYPEVWRTFEEPEDLDAKAKRDTAIVSMGYRPASVDYINETYGGDWVEKEPQAPTVPPQQTAGQAAVAAAFADAAPGAVADPLQPLVDRLAAAADAPIGVIIERIRREADAATDLADFATRLLAISDLSIDDLAGELQQALTVAQLGGIASVGAGGDGG
jgi:phage gp29-like protein